MRKYTPHVLIISFVFLLTPTVHAVSDALEIETYKQEVEKNPDDADAHYNLGLAYEVWGEYKEAIESYKQSIRIDPDYAKAHNNLGVTYLKSGKYEEAIEKLSETKVKLSVPLIASFIAKQYRQSDIAKAYNVPEDHSNKGPLPENHLCS